MLTPAAIADGRQDRVERALAAIGHRSRDDFRCGPSACEAPSQRRANIRCGKRALEGVRRDNDAWHVAEIGSEALDALECSATSCLREMSRTRMAAPVFFCGTMMGNMKIQLHTRVALA